MADIANTNARLSTSVTLRVLQGNLTTDILANTAALAALANSAVKLGAVISWEETERRTTDPRYELDADVAGDMVERIPRVIEERSIRINRAILNTSTIMEAFGLSVDEILTNSSPLAIVKVERPPTGSTLATKTTIYTGLWFHSVPKVYNIAGGDLKVMENCELGFTAKVIV